MKGFNGLKNVAGVLGLVFVSLGILLHMSGGSKEQKVEYRGVVTNAYSVNNQGVTSEVLVFEMEPAFQQTVASNEETIEATVISSNGSGVEVQDASGIIYRINETKVEPINPTVGQTVQADVIVKEGRKVLLQTSTPYQIGANLTFRDNLQDASTVGYKEIDGITHEILKLDVPINTVEIKESLANRYILSSNGKAFTVSLCQGKYYLMPSGTHDEDGLFQVNEESNKLNPVSPSDISNAPCSIQDGYIYDSAAGVFQAHPFTPSNKGFNFLFYTGITLAMLLLITSGMWIEGLQLLFSSSKTSK